MSTVAQQYPAHTDSNGVTWWRPGAGRMDGWTSQPEGAHESYQCFRCLNHPSLCSCSTPLFIDEIPKVYPA